MTRATNQIYDPNEIYNRDVKEQFLTSRFENEDSRVTYRRIFNNSYFIETELGRDLYTFNIDEIKRLLSVLQPLKLSASTQNGAMIRSYLSWAIEEGYRDQSINPLDSIVDTKTFYKQFVDQTKETIFHVDKIKYVVDHCENYQDAAVVQMIFEGVLGESCSELLNLTEKDIDFDNNFLTLRDKDDSVREIPVSEDCMRLIKGALNQTEYVKRNGQTSKDIRNPINKLVENNYVLKKARARANDEGRGDIHLILRRLKMLSDVFEIDYFTATNIRNSGMLWAAKGILDARRRNDPQAELTKIDYDVICQRYGISKVMNNGHEMYNYFPYRNDFLNIETIDRIYGNP